VARAVTRATEDEVSKRIAINGFGRIGRCVARQLLAKPDRGVEIVAVNDLASPTTLARLLMFDSIHRRAGLDVRVEEDAFVVGDTRIRSLAEPDPSKLPWKELGVDVVLECTGRLRKREKAAAHLRSGASKVILSAPGIGSDVTLCFGINEDVYDPNKHEVISNASCTTNCLAPMIDVLDKELGIERGHMVTVHSYTGDQSLVDSAHDRDARRGRAAGLSMVPTSSGAATAVAEVFPHLAGKLDGMAVRVPTPNVSLTCFTSVVKSKAEVAAINEAYREAAEGRLAGILAYEERPLVSMDFVGETYSAILDAQLTQVVDGHLVEVQAWYDNEWGYAARLLDMACFVAHKD
jgi:glyceraldehyde 3-phosphate dehydrogenase